MAEAEHGYGINRRSFVAGAVSVLGGIIAAVIGLPGLGYLIAPGLKRPSGDEWIPLGSIDDLAVGLPKLFSFTRTQQVGWERTAISYGVYVVKHVDGRLQALSNVCTHLSCRVTWKEDLGEYICPCHDGHFAVDGAIISGPQPRPLDGFEFRVEDGSMLIHLVEG
jgi:menaquinol-cytochrome c reductase iron-sulfur subunit